MNLLGDFLAQRRRLVDPARHQLSTVGPRRTPGLRREELAALAGISVEYLIRLERGRDRNPSSQVVRALADALLLEADARTHLNSLVLASSGFPSPPAAEGNAVVDQLRRLVERWSTPTMITSRYLDVLALNRACHVLYDPWDIGVGTNMVRHAFTHPSATELYLDFDDIAGETVANLRWQVGAHQDDPALQRLVGELSVRSERFAALWARGDVAAKTAGTKRVWHPRLGELELQWSALVAPGTDGVQVVSYLGAPGSHTERQLATLPECGPSTATNDARGA